MAGPKKHKFRREGEKPAGPLSSSTQSSTSAGASVISFAQESVKTTSTSAHTKLSAQYDGPMDSQGGALQVGPSSVQLRNLESLGLSFYRGLYGVSSNFDTPKRNGVFSTVGQEISVKLNTFDVKKMPSIQVQQYDITIVGMSEKERGAPSRMVQMKVWKSKTLTKALGNAPWLFDGNKLGWSTLQIKKLNVTVDLNVEEGRKPSDKNKFRVLVNPTRVVSFSHLYTYMQGQTDYDNSDANAVSLLDHLLREGPSGKYTQIKRNFFARGSTRFSLGQGVEAFKGVYASMRPVLNAQRLPGFSVNIDVANGTFLTAMDLIDSVAQMLRARGPEDVIDMFNHSKNDWHKSNMYRALRAYTHVSVKKKYMQGPMAEVKIYKFVPKDPYEIMLDIENRDANANVVSTQKITLAAYFLQKYNLRARKGFPCVELTKKVKGKPEHIPLEALAILPNQRYKLKLDEKQTSNMIKFAVTLPKDRWAAVEHGLRMLDWPNDPYLKAFGVEISTQPTVVKGRLLPCPEPSFANGKIDAKSASQGRWRIDGKKFYKPNSKPLKSWGVAIVDTGRGPCITQKQAEHFFDRFSQVARQHGMQVDGEYHAFVVKAMRGGEMISDAWNNTGNKFQAKPHLLVFVVPSKSTDLYKRIKKSCDCRYGVVSQVLQSSHVMKAQDQYISNVCMKVNAKLGGATCVARGGLNKLNPNWGKVPTMIIGADVSHAAPGDTTASMAAFTMSLDKEFTRFAALCETNGHRVEIIATHVINTKLRQMAILWAQQFGGQIPQEVVYFRDGVSEGQFQFVLNQEVADMKEMFRGINPKVPVPKFTVVICGKRHHVRFFPGRAGDRNENPIPGTLVETGVTHPFEVDYYLASHSAIKGTARPVHYNVIANENKYSIPFIEQLTFEHCMQYARSTTPVSMVPAVYYAHLASNRATAHINAPTVSSGKKEAMEKSRKGTTIFSSSDKTATEAVPLIELNPNLGILQTMWYI